MSLLTTVSRMWLTRTTKPFTFDNVYDNKLSFQNLENLGLYVHLPFCKTLCDFCPYCKQVFDSKTADRYIDSLIQEIKLVTKDLTQKKVVTSLYFGGGTPALVANRISEIISELNKHFIITEGIGLELHPENVNPETLATLKEAGVTKISIGIQSFNEKFCSVLGRKPVDVNELSKNLSTVSFETVSMDFIFALPEQNIEDLKSDIEKAFSGGANHIAIYPFIDFSFTKSSVPAMSKSKKRKLLDEITLYCQEKGYKRDSIWTFSNKDSAKYSSMTRDNFLGFGCSATTLLKDSFKINTFSVEHYIERIKNKKLPTSLTIRFTTRQRMVYFLFWSAYSTHVDAKSFEDFFSVPLKKMYGFEIFLAKKLRYITETNGILSMTLKGAFYYHHYENFYTLSYIDKMWSIMRNQPFPKCIKF